MTDLTDEALDRLVAALTAIDHTSIEDCFLQSPYFLKAAAAITALRQREAEAVAGAKAEGMREAAAWHEERAKDEDALSSKYRGGSNPWFAHVQMAKIHRDSASAILAAADKLEEKS